MNASQNLISTLTQSYFFKLKIVSYRIFPHRVVDSVHNAIKEFPWFALSTRELQTETVLENVFCLAEENNQELYFRLLEA